MSTQLWSQESSQGRKRLLWLMNSSARVIVVALGYSILPLLTSGRPSFSSVYLQKVFVDLITGAVYALVLLPLARRLPYRLWVRVIALFIPLYWMAVLGNIIEAYFFTTFSRVTLTVGAIFLAFPTVIACLLIAWLFPAYKQEQPVPGIWQTLRQRPLLSWIWRIAVVSLLYPIFLQYVFGALTNLFIGQYYHDPAFMAQSHTTANVPDAIFWLDETLRGLLFALSLLPVLAVMRGRTWPKILYTALYIVLLDAAFEAWLSMLSQTAFAMAVRIGEALDLTGDALARGIFIALFLALPMLTNKQQQDQATSVKQAQVTEGNDLA